MILSSHCTENRNKISHGRQGLSTGPGVREVVFYSWLYHSLAGGACRARYRAGMETPANKFLLCNFSSFIMHKSAFFQHSSTHLKAGETWLNQNTESAENENEWKTSITTFSRGPLKYWNRISTHTAKTEDQTQPRFQQAHLQLLPQSCTRVGSGLLYSSSSLICFLLQASFLRQQTAKTQARGERFGLVFRN